MQLFSIGLWALDGDGTYALDADGARVMTYTNDDIVTLSRAWTGFRTQEGRGNVENADGAADGGDNELDPMRLQVLLPPSLPIQVA